MVLCINTLRWIVEKQSACNVSVNLEKKYLVLKQYIKIGIRSGYDIIDRENDVIKSFLLRIIPIPISLNFQNSVKLQTSILLSVNKSVNQMQILCTRRKWPYSSVKKAFEPHEIIIFVFLSKKQAWNYKILIPYL